MRLFLRWRAGMPDRHPRFCSLRRRRKDDFEHSPRLARADAGDEQTLMKLLSVNVSRPKEMAYRGKKVMTGIFKTPVSGRVMVRALNVDGDAQADLKVHGGPDQAVYAYPHEHY